MTRYKIAETPGSSRMQRADWKKWLTRGATLGRTALQLYIGVKRREPVYIGIGVADAVQTISDWNEEETGFDIVQEMHAREQVLLYSENQHMRFLYYTVQQMDLPNTRIEFAALHKKNKGAAKWTAVCYDVCGCDLYFIFNGIWLQYVYGSDADTVLVAFSKAVREHMGQYIALTVTTENWTSYIGLASLESHLEAYISPLDIADFCTTAKKFQNKKHNRAHLLYGQPGTGKTTFANLVARELGGRLLVIEGSPLNKIVDYGIQLDKLVDIVQPRVILFDDMDRTSKPEELFGEVERLNRTHRTNNILVLGSVNHLESLPEALCREGRFDSIVEFTLPDTEMRKRILQAHLEQEGIRIMNSYVDSVVEWSEGLSGAALRELALQISIRGFDATFIKESIEHRKRLHETWNKNKGKNSGNEKVMICGESPVSDMVQG